MFIIRLSTQPDIMEECNILLTNCEICIDSHYMLWSNTPYYYILYRSGICRKRR